MGNRIPTQWFQSMQSMVSHFTWNPPFSVSCISWSRWTPSDTVPLRHPPVPHEPTNENEIIPVPIYVRPSFGHSSARILIAGIWGNKFHGNFELNSCTKMDEIKIRKKSNFHSLSNGTKDAKYTEWVYCWDPFEEFAVWYPSNRDTFCVPWTVWKLHELQVVNTVNRYPINRILQNQSAMTPIAWGTEDWNQSDCEWTKIGEMQSDILYIDHSQQVLKVFPEDSGNSAGTAKISVFTVRIQWEFQ